MMAFISLFGSLEFALYFFEDVDFSVQLPPSRDNYISKYKVSNACGNKDVFHEMKKESYFVFIIRCYWYFLYGYDFKN